MTISVLFLTNYPIKTPLHGGQLRARALYDAYVAQGAQVRSIALYEPEIYPGHAVSEYDLPFPQSARHYHGGSIPFITDYLGGVYATSTEGYALIKTRLPERVDIIHVEQPWLFDLAIQLSQESACCHAKLVYGSQNIEAPLKRDIFNQYKVKNTDTILSTIESLEITAQQQADFVLAVSHADQLAISKNTQTHVLHAPNGIKPWAATQEKIMAWAKKVPIEPWALFVGSAHPPNLQGFIDCLGNSLACIPPTSKIVVVGNVGHWIYNYYNDPRWRSITLPRLDFYPNLPEEDFIALKELASVYLLPITYGGGSNIKTAEAIYSRKPTLGTTYGFRDYESYLSLPGIHIADDQHTFRKTLSALLINQKKIRGTPEESVLRQQVLWQNCLASSIKTILESIKIIPLQKIKCEDIHLRAKAEQAEMQVQQLQQALHAMMNSRSWRITAPLRWCALQARRLHDQGFWSRLVNIAQRRQQMRVPQKQRIGWISPWNTRCGIASYSAHLIEHIPASITILAARSEQLNPLDSSNVIRCWKVGEDNLDHLSHVIKNYQINTLVIQFHYGFFNFEKFRCFLNAQINKGIKVVLTLHCTTDPEDAPNKGLAQLQNTLARCHRILVHAPNDLHRLSALGLNKNVTLFPHGIYDYTPPSLAALSPSNPSKKTVFHIASYGFFRAHKGLLELIEALALLRRTGLDVHLHMINAQYPAPDSITTIEQAKIKIAMLNLTNYIEMNTNFLSDEESLDLLNQADLIVFPYQETGESASGAVRYGLAAGRPVAVTPLLIFEDVAPAVFTLPGCTPEQIAQGIASLLDAIKNNTPEIDAKKTAAVEWCKIRRYSYLGPKLLRILQDKAL